MKKSLFLLILLFSSSLIICQTTDTKNTKCFDADQISELYKGIQQNSYLKNRLSKTENALDNADAVIKSQKNTIAKADATITEQTKLIQTNIDLCASEKEILNAQIFALNSDLKLEKTKAKIEKRKELWKGVKIGGITVGVVGTAAVLFLVTR